MVYSNLILPFVKSERNRNICRIAITLFGQSVWFLLLSRTYSAFKVYDRIFYFLFIWCLYMFIAVFFIKVFNLFIKFEPKRMVSISLVVTFLIVVYGSIAPFFPVITRYKIETTKDVNAKIALITDLHIGDIMMRPYTLQKAMDKIKKEDVDYLFIGGDIIEGNVGSFDRYKDIFLNSGIETYAVLGNHDYYRKEYMDGVRKFEEVNIKVLMDEYVNLDEFVLIGREDKTNSGRAKLADIVKGVDKTRFTLLLDHQPQFFDEAVEENIDLYLAGHTHNGQIFPFNFVVKNIYEKPYGLLKKQNSTLITSSGIGGWGPPIKIMSPVEIVIAEIVSN
ncbi:MAG: metallophosphoesterase [Rickettsiales bacterium]|jgi:predicted MPP superfamily phosphohydrolase|nr:metallophosphoesterase [Rickettsiales bacterium]